MDQELEKEERCLGRIFTTPDGKRALQILERDFYDRPSYVRSEPQPYHTFYREGQRDVVGFIKETIERCQTTTQPSGRKTSLKT